MAIRIITGKPGSGKTFYAVKHIRDNYFHPKNEKWLKNKDVTIISNIHHLKLKHKNLDDILKEENIDFEQFFCNDFQKKYAAGEKLIYFIDECQQYLHKRFYNKEVFYYFQTHRHLGHDIYLITQNINLIPIQIKELAETEIHALPRNISFFGEFKYTVKSNNENIDKKFLKKDKKIFHLYQSFKNEEIEKIGNPLIKYVLASIIIFLGAGFLFYNTFFDESEAKESYTYNNQYENSIEKAQIRVVEPELKIIKPIKKIYELIPTRVDYVITKDKIWVIEPITKVIIPIDKLPYKFSIDRYGNRIEIVALVRADLIKEKKETSTIKHY